MENTITLAEGVQILQNWMINAPKEVAAQDAALKRYGEYFALKNIDNITQDGFKEFLLFKNNQHWTGINRQPNIYADMQLLRKALKMLLDESKPVQHRLDVLIPKGKPTFIRGLNRAVLTPILMCVYPDQYAVYNNISREGLQRLGRDPIKKSDAFSKRYIDLNLECHKISSEIKQPLTRVDAMFSLIVHGGDSPLLVSGTGDESTALDGDQENGDSGDAKERLSFQLETVLKDFLIKNWDRTELAQTLDLVEEDGEPATEVQTGVGNIDILAQDKKTKDWVVIELKKGKGSDKVLGQLLRYMGWIKKHRAEGNQQVRGIISVRSLKA